jgi:hypothetical protein
MFQMRGGARRRIVSKNRGNPKYLFALTDDQTRFWIAHQDLKE